MKPLADYAERPKVKALAPAIAAFSLLELGELLGIVVGLLAIRAGPASTLAVVEDARQTLRRRIS